MFMFGAGPGAGLRLDPVHRRVHLGVHRRAGHPGAAGLVVPDQPAQDTADRVRTPCRVAPDQASCPTRRTSGSCAFAQAARAVSIVGGDRLAVRLDPVMLALRRPELRHRLPGRHRAGADDAATAPSTWARRARRCSGLGLGDVQVQAFGDASTAQVRFQTPEGADPAADGGSRAQRPAHRRWARTSASPAPTWSGPRSRASCSAAA